MRISEFISDFGPSSQRLGRSIFFGPPLGAEEWRKKRAARRSTSVSPGWKIRRRRRLMAGPDLTAADIVAYPGLKPVATAPLKQFR